MSLIIRHYKKDVSTEERWDSALEDAKDIVCGWVRDGIVDRVEIVGANDEILFNYPPRV